MGSSWMENQLKLNKLLSQPLKVVVDEGHHLHQEAEALQEALEEEEEEEVVEEQEDHPHVEDIWTIADILLTSTWGLPGDLFQ